MSELTLCTPKIRDYIIPQPEVNTKAAASYEVVVSNDTDFVVRKKLAKKTKLLAVIISKGLFYIRDESAEVDELANSRKIRAFFRGLGEEELPLPGCKWLKSVTSGDLDYIINIVEDPTHMEMVRHGIPLEAEDMAWAAAFWEKNRELFQLFLSYFPKVRRLHPHATFLRMAFCALEVRGLDSARYFLEKLRDSEMEYYNMYRLDYDGALNKYREILENEEIHLDFRAFTDYLFFGLIRQGIDKIDHSILYTYYDYLKLQMKMYGKVEEKYPANLKTAHDVMVMKSNLRTKAYNADKFKDIMAPHAGLAHQSNRYCILVPTQLNEVEEEGLHLDNYGRSIDRIIDQECVIVFLREARKPDIPLVTVQVRDGKVDMAEGDSRRDIRKEERDYLKRWARDNGLVLAV